MYNGKTSVDTLEPFFIFRHEKTFTLARPYVSMSYQKQRKISNSNFIPRVTKKIILIYDVSKYFKNEIRKV